MGDSSWQIAMTRPAYLAALVVLPLVVYRFWRSRDSFARWQRNASLAVRVLLLLLCIFALCGIKVTAPSRQQFVVFAVDRSRSISAEGVARAVDFIVEAKRHAGRNQVACLQFAARPGSVANGCGGEAAEARPADPLGTNLAAAIAAARAAIAEGYVPQIVLLSDGNQTDGDALAAAKAAAVPIATVPLAGPKNEVYVAAVRAPSQVRAGEPFDADVLIHSAQDDEGTVRLLCGSHEVAAERRKISRGENCCRFTVSLAERPHATLTARISGFQDTLAENNEAAAVVFVAPQPRVLLVDSQPELAAPLAAALGGASIEVDLRGPQEMPGSLDDLQKYQLLMLSNVSAASLSAAQMKIIQAYVRDDGGGLIAVGGDQSFTPGGYRNTALEEVLPLVSHARKDKSKASLALVLIIDCSGSMEGESIALARQASRQAVEMLGPRDQLGIIAFEDQSHWVSRLHPCSDPQRVLRQIDTITAGGRTNMYPAMDKAFLALRESFAELKHMIVLTDGLSEPGDFHALSKEIAAAGITVSTVGIGAEAAQPLLREIAEVGKGHYYYCADAAAVPRVFTLETMIAGRLGICQEPFSVQVAEPTGILEKLNFRQAPVLLGYAETLPKPSSRVILAAGTGDPLLAWWRYGRGTSVAFTSDVHDRWAAAWLHWPGFGPFWVRLARYAMRAAEPDNFSLHLERQRNRVVALLEARDSQRQLLHAAEATLQVTAPGEKSREISFLQVAPGRYAAQFAVEGPGTYLAEAAVRRQGQLLLAARGGLVVGYPDELRLRPTNEDLLRAIATASGGRYNPEPAAVFASCGRSVPRTTPAWRWLLTAAVLVFLGEVALRQIPRIRRR